jgi:hypothetical protein
VQKCGLTLSSDPFFEDFHTRDGALGLIQADVRIDKLLKDIAHLLMS